MNFQNRCSNRGMEFQNKIQGLLEKSKLKVIVLDKDNNSSKPDFLIINNKSDQMIGECKGIFSAGYRNSCHVSTLDKNFINDGVIDHYELDLINIEKVFKKSQSQLEQLIIDNPEKYGNHPFVVFLHLDFFADDFLFIPKNLFGLRKISAVAMIERNMKRSIEFEKCSSEEIKKIINGTMKIKLPPESVEFKILVNSSSQNKLKVNNFFSNPIIIK